MNAPVVAAATASLLLFSSFAYAQDSAPATAPAAAVGECSLGSHADVDDADARTAADIVCAEVARRGMHAGAHYRVGLGKLGHTVVLSLSMETAPGVIAEHRQLEISGLEEVPVAAPRLVDAVNRGEAIEETQRVGNVVDGETQAPLTKKGTVHFDIGVLAVQPFLAKYGWTGTPAPGMEMAIHYERNNFATGVGLRVAGNSASDHNGSSVGFVGLAVGGRYYLTDTDIAPFIGGGLVLSYEQVTTKGWDPFGASGVGVGAFGEIGVTMLRTHHSHLSLGLRADVPFYQLTESPGPTVSCSGLCVGGAESPSPLYAVPISVAATFTF
jgi:hypothetical protein